MKYPFKQRIWQEGANSDVGENRMIREAQEKKSMHMSKNALKSQSIGEHRS